MPFSSTVIMMGCSLAICLSNRMSRGLQNLRSKRTLSAVHPQQLQLHVVVLRHSSWHAHYTRTHGSPASSCFTVLLFIWLFCSLTGCRDADLMSATVAVTPLFASISAAARALLTMVPYATSATSLPPLLTTPLPIYTHTGNND